MGNDRLGNRSAKKSSIESGYEARSSEHSTEEVEELLAGD